MSRVTVSPTKLDAWQSCPRRYRLQYIERIKVDGRWAHFTVANAVHGALRDWFDLEPAARTAEVIPGLIGKSWSKAGFRDDDQAATWFQIAASMVSEYLERHRPSQPFSCERTLGALTEHAAITGRIDRIDEAQGSDRESGELVIVDYKTGKQVPTDDDARVSRALAIYASTVRMSLRRPCFTVQLHHVPTGVVAQARHTPESLQRQLDRVDSLARDIAVAEESGDVDAFPPAPGPLCGWCDFREHCPEGRGVAPKERWAGLAEVDDQPSLDGPSTAQDSQP